MSKKKTLSVIVDTILAGSIVVSVLFFKKFYRDNYLRIKKLIGKDTKTLNVYTCEYVSAVFPCVDVQDEKCGNISSVGTNIAKKKAIFGLIDNKSAFEKYFKKEYAQIVRFSIELDKLAPHAQMIIYVLSEENAQKYINLKEDIKSIRQLSINVKVYKENAEYVAKY